LPLVSMDFKKSDVSTTIDSSLTMVMGDDMVKVGHLHTCTYTRIFLAIISVALAVALAPCLIACCC